MTELTPEELQEIIGSDKRFLAIDIGAQMAAELRDSRALSMFLTALAQEAQDCLVEFSELPVADPLKVMPLQVRVRALMFLNRTIETILETAKAGRGARFVRITRIR